MKPFLFLALSASLLAACAPTTRVILLPQEGRSTAVLVNTAEGKALLDKPYAEAQVDKRGQVETTVTDAKAVNKRFGDVLQATPPVALKFTLNFVTGTSTLTPEAMAELEPILKKASERSGGEIFVTGHTDTVGSDAGNDALSLKRAQAVRQLFIDRGFDAARVVAAGRGKRQPLVPTGDQVDEPRNRRVEIEVR